MEKLHYMLGFPRTCSTVLARILNQNPRIFVSNTSPTPYFIDTLHRKTGDWREMIAMEESLGDKAYINFLYSGLKGWYETLTDKPVVISKSKMWAAMFPHTFQFDANSKYLFLVRDLRDIFASMENNWRKNRHLPIGPDNAIKIKDYVKLIADKIGWNGHVNWNTKPKRPGEIYLLNSTNHKITTRLGWFPKVELSDGLNKTIQSWKNILENNLPHNIDKRFSKGK